MYSEYQNENYSFHNKMAAGTDEFLVYCNSFDLQTGEERQKKHKFHFIYSLYLLPFYEILDTFTSKSYLRKTISEF